MKLSTLLEAEEKSEMGMIMAKAKDLCLEIFKHYATEDHDDIQMVLDNELIQFGDQLQLASGKAHTWNADMALAEKHLEKIKAKEWEELFKAKFKTTVEAIIANGEKAGMKKFSADEQKFIEWAGTQMGTKISIKDFNAKNEDHIRYYMKSPTKVVISLPHTAGAVITDESLARFKLSMQKVKEMFDRFDIKISKRPSYKHATPALYDGKKEDMKLSKILEAAEQLTPEDMSAIKKLAADLLAMRKKSKSMNGTSRAGSDSDEFEIRYNEIMSTEADVSSQVSSRLSISAIEKAITRAVKQKLTSIAKMEKMVAGKDKELEAYVKEQVELSADDFT